MQGFGNALPELSNVSNSLVQSGIPGSPVLTDLSQSLDTVQGIKSQFDANGQPGTRQSASISHITLSAAGSTVTFASITLPVNPSAIKFEKSVAITGSQQTIASDFDNMIKATGNLIISLTDVMLLGDPFVATTLDTLIRLATPWEVEKTQVLSQGANIRSPGLVVPSITKSPDETLARTVETTTVPTLNPNTAKAPAQETAVALPEVIFAWGKGLCFIVTIRSVSADITRVSMNGLPLQAKVNLKFQVEPKAPPYTNPTSGGPSGRGTHTVTSGETIVGIAVRRYGDPSVWRGIAVANGLDDALRLTSGAQLYLPGRAELAGIEEVAA